VCASVGKDAGAEKSVSSLSGFYFVCCVGAASWGGWERLCADKGLTPAGRAISAAGARRIIGGGGNGGMGGVGAIVRWWGRLSSSARRPRAGRPENLYKETAGLSGAWGAQRDTAGGLGVSTMRPSAPADATIWK
jgi:hypothetical protein